MAFNCLCFSEASHLHVHVHVPVYNLHQDNWFLQQVTKWGEKIAGLVVVEPGISTASFKEWGEGKVRLLYTVELTFQQCHEKCTLLASIITHYRGEEGGGGGQGAVTSSQTIVLYFVPVTKLKLLFKLIPVMKCHTIQYHHKKKAH